MTSVVKSVDLGFAEDIDNDEIAVSCKIIPCVIGGNPRWLDLENLPTSVQCRTCEQPTVFLCQVYAPIEEDPDCFHRTIFVFICKNESCCKPNNADNIICLRSQLPRSNKFYPSDLNDLDNFPFEEVMNTRLRCPESFNVQICNVCGCRGPHRCAKCKLITYCSKAHQTIDWPTHKLECGNRSVKGIQHYMYEIRKSKFLFPKFELTLEQEDEDKLRAIGNVTDDDDDDDTEDDTNETNLKDYQDFLKLKNLGADNVNFDETELQKYANIEDDPAFMYFKKRTAIHPDQVLRYNKGESPLWITSKCQLNINDVPPCENCNSPRQFEFQIMPQLLFTLGEEVLDWGIIAVYTCTKSCSPNGKYVREFVYKQDILKDDDKIDE